MIGKQVQQFRITQPLGQGGMGEVFLAEDTKLKRKVALKFLPAHYSQDPDFKSRFEHEATASAALNHPNIVTVYELGEFEGKPFIAMEYIEGESLEAVIQAGDIKLDKAVRIAHQVLEGLSAAHAAGIVHRDIKPGNIIIDQSGRVKLLDFGLAKSRRATTETQAGTTVGTVQYESPEQGRGEQVDPRSDLFSVGVVLYEMIAGRLPFQGEFTDAIRYAIAHDTPEPLERYKSDVPPELQRIVSKLLEKDPALRFQHAEDAVADLKLLERDSGSRVSTAYRPVRPDAPRSARRPRWLIPALIIGLLAVIFVLVKPEFHFTTFRTAEAEENRLAVLYFDNVTDPTDEQRLGEIATNLLITDLSQSRDVQVVSSQRLYDLLKQLGHEGTKTITQDLATQVAQKANARWMLTGQILRTEPTLLLTSQLVETSSGEVVGSNRINGADGEDIFALVDRLSDSIRGDLSLPAPSDTAQNVSLADVTTHSTEAYRHYLAGIELRDKFFMQEATREFRRAAEIDSTFAMAYYRLAEMGVGGEEGRRANLESAARHAEHASDLERRYIKALQQSLDDGRAAIDTYEKIARDYPEEKFAFSKLYGLVADEFGTDSAIPYLERVIELDPLDKNAYNRLAYAYDAIGDFDASIRSINKYLDLAPDEPNPYDSRGDLYAGHAEFAQAADSYRRAVEIKPDFYLSLTKLGDMYVMLRQYEKAESCFTVLATSDQKSSRAEGRMRLSTIPAYQGKLDSAIQLLHSGLAADGMEKAGFGSFTKHLSIAVLEWLRGRYEEAFEAARQAHQLIAALIPGDPDQVRSTYAWLARQTGRTELADSLMAELRHAYERLGRQDDSRLLLSESLYAGARGDTTRMFALLEQVRTRGYRLELGDRFLFARAYLARGETGEAVQLLEDAIQSYDPRSTPVALPAYALCHYWLAVAYEQSGWSRKAIEQYEFFLDLWHDADAGFPAVEDARARLGALQS